MRLGAISVCVNVTRCAWVYMCMGVYVRYVRYVMVRVCGEQSVGRECTTSVPHVVLKSRKESFELLLLSLLKLTTHLYVDTHTREHTH